MPPPHRPPSDRSGLSRFWLLPLLIVLLLAGCVSPLDSGRDRTPLALADVARLSRLSFPDGARLTSSTYQAFQDWYLTASVEFPASGMDGFLADNGLEAVPGLRAVTNRDRQQQPAWDPDAAADVRGVPMAGQPIDGVSRRLLFDLDRPDVVVVYLVAFTS